MKKILVYLILIFLLIQLIFAVDTSGSKGEDEGISISTSLSGSGSESERGSSIIGEEGETSSTSCPPCSFSGTNTSKDGDYSCGSYKCNSEIEVCQSVYGINDGCIPREKLNVTIETKVINSWSENNNKDNYTQYDATIINNVNRDIKQVYIYVNPELFKFRDKSSLWNMIPDPTKENHLILPLYQKTINANKSFTFGFIIESPLSQEQDKSLNLTINQITFA